MKPYPAYKDSGIEWIGEIPNHWETKRLKFLGNVVPSNVDKKTKEGEKKVLLCNYVDVYKNDFITDGINFMKASASDNQIDKLSLRKNDVIATKDSEDPKDIGVPSLVKNDFTNVVCGYHLTLIRSSEQFLKGDFFYWVMRSEGSSQYFYTEARGITRYAIGSQVFRNFNISLPNSLNEQTQIANYLDKKTAQIDSLIAKKESLIKLLEEEKTALINQAVTKGLDPNVKMKDTGIEWLGEIPEHWEVIRLKFLLDTPLKYGANEAAINENRSEPRYIRITDFKKNGELKKDTFKSLPSEKAKNYLLENGDILFARSGATVGKTFYFENYRGSACFAGYLIKASSNKSILIPRFLYLFTMSGSYENWKESISQQATIQNIGADKYNQLKLAIPPVKEQEKIIKHSVREEKRIKDIKLKVKKEIELLKEYKTTLISEVITGKVDVR